jgi:hypothetical protein
MGAPRVISGLEIWNRQDDLPNRAKTLTVWVSSDAAGPWQEIWRASDVQKQWTVKLEQSVHGRFVKMGLREPNIFHLFSVKVYGQKIGATR